MLPVLFNINNQFHKLVLKCLQTVIQIFSNFIKIENYILPFNDHLSNTTFSLYLLLSTHLKGMDTE